MRDPTPVRSHMPANIAIGGSPPVAIDVSTTDVTMIIKYTNASIKAATRASTGSIYYFCTTKRCTSARCPNPRKATVVGSSTETPSSTPTMVGK